MFVQKAQASPLYRPPLRAVRSPLTSSSSIFTFFTGSEDHDYGIRRTRLSNRNGEGNMKWSHSLRIQPYSVLSVAFLGPSERSGSKSRGAVLDLWPGFSRGGVRLGVLGPWRNAARILVGIRAILFTDRDCETDSSQFPLFHSCSSHGSGNSCHDAASRVSRACNMALCAYLWYQHTTCTTTRGQRSV